MRRLLILCVFVIATAEYQPNWKSIDSRPLPDWYDDGKVGIFLHWGLFSVPSFGSEWFWEYWQRQKLPAYVQFMKKNFRPNFTYADFGSSFTAEFYDPEKWADIFKASGAKYIVLTSKHHEGFTMWPSKVSWNWNAFDVGPKRDLLGDLANAIRKHTDIRFGVYHSLFEWFNPLFLDDQANNFTTRRYVDGKSLPELYELVYRYKPEVIWSDGDAAPDTYWNSTGFLAWLYNSSPVKDTVVVNDRWGNGISCHHGGFFTCQDRYNPGKLQPRKWENAMTLDKSSWGFRRDAKLGDILTIEELITTLAQTICYGGNLLINVGPTHDGRIVPVFEERLRQLGSWLDVNGEAVYNTTPWQHQNDTIAPNVWYTMKGKNNIEPIVYAIVTKWPKANTLVLGSLTFDKNSYISMLGLPGKLTWQPNTKGGSTVIFPALTPDELPCQWAWVLKVNPNN